METGLRAVTRAGDTGEHDELLAGISHELRAALTPLKGYLTLIAQGELDPVGDDRSEMFDILLRQIARLEQLVDTLPMDVDRSAPRGVRRVIVIDGDAEPGA